MRSVQCIEKESESSLDGLEPPTFQITAECADLGFREILTKMKVECFPRTSDRCCLHVYDEELGISLNWVNVSSEQ